jgi:hypothetical protein
MYIQCRDCGADISARSLRDIRRFGRCPRCLANAIRHAQVRGLLRVYAQTLRQEAPSGPPRSP